MKEKATQARQVPVLGQEREKKGLEGLLSSFPFPLFSRF